MNIGEFLAGTKLSYQKKKTLGIVLISLVVSLSVQIFGGLEKVNAVPDDYDSYGDCLEASNGREDIDTVEETCSWDCNHCCSLWLGSSHSTTVKIRSGYTGDTIDIPVYGMCTGDWNQEEYTAYNVRVIDSSFMHGEIDDFVRGSWGFPTYGGELELDIEDFKEVASKRPGPNGSMLYTAPVTIYREHNKHKNSGTSVSTITLELPNNYFGRSCIDEVCAGITNKSETAPTKTYWMRPNVARNINFSHYLYSDGQQNSVRWSVTRSGFTTNFQPTPSGSSSGSAGLYSRSSGYYYATANSTNYRLTYGNIGGYPAFCERLFYNPTNSNYTRVCGNVYVPYNFVNTTSIDLSDGVVYAGERTTARNLKVTVNPTYNSAVGATYATASPSTQVRVITYSSSSNDSGRSYQVRAGAGTNLCAGFPYKNGQCAVVASTSAQNINSSHNANGQTVSPSINQTYNVYDTNAGDWFCVASAVYPYSSGSATNYSDANGSYSWYISKPVCRQVAKKPNFQIWGGSLYSNGKVKTGVSTKNNLLGVSGYGYSATGGNIRVYGSWAEVGVSSIGTVTGLASGAATGRTSDGVGGSKEGTAANYCKYRTPLSFSNYSSISTLCPNTSATGQVGTSPTKLDKNSLVDYIAKGNTPNTSGNNINLNDKNNYTETANENNTLVHYTYNNGNISLAGTTLPKGITHVVRSTGTITVNGNIAYDNTNYTQLTEVPKLILYAENINIDCSVTRLDAIIIANKNVNTCPSTDYNSATNSRQLKINGVIIADKLYLNRTYGAAAGVNSGVPAEIINYDSSTLLWTDAMTDTTKSDILNITYKNELAPRY